ncbi:unnamed protein product [Coffea canephora]|uniref:Uncharacterized protein n=1 Tax=Coffea canephora TaxID=49390 RepID=A0A068UBT2_COFCA|nr:unnamed protein product [Coffea canephora]
MLFIWQNGKSLLLFSYVIHLKLKTGLHFLNGIIAETSLTFIVIALTSPINFEIALTSPIKSWRQFNRQKWVNLLKYP